jgi:translocation protein SEC63
MHLFFPEPKFEEWWVFLVESTSSKIIAFEKIKATDRIVEEKLRFQVSKPGKHAVTLHALCDAYAGIDKKIDLVFNVYEEEDAKVKREIFIHKEDEDLDLQPTLFQQFMGELNNEEESEDEEEGEKKSQKEESQEGGRQGRQEERGWW